MILSLSLGLLTHHMVGSNLDYCGKINNSGTIHNPYAIVTAGDKNTKGGIIVGKDSTCSNIYGLVFEQNLYKNFDIVLGGYNTNYDEYVKRGMKPIHIDEKITPIVGLNYKINIYKGKDYSINLNNLFNHYLTTHAINFTF